MLVNTNVTTPTYATNTITLDVLSSAYSTTEPPENYTSRLLEGLDELKLYIEESEYLPSSGLAVDFLQRFMTGSRVARAARGTQETAALPVVEMPVPDFQPGRALDI